MGLGVYRTVYGAELQGMSMIGKSTQEYAERDDRRYGIDILWRETGR